jgi:hypothetical protein
MTHKAKRIGPGHYIYRGITIKRRERILSGYWGAWYTIAATHERDIRAGSLKEIKEKIDNAAKSAAALDRA